MKIIPELLERYQLGQCTPEEKKAVELLFYDDKIKKAPIRICV